MRCNMTFLFMSSHWHHVMPMVSSMVSLYSLHQDNQNEMEHYIFGQWYHWYWHQHHIMPMSLLMAPLHSLQQDCPNEMQYEFLSHVTLLMPVSHVAEIGLIIHQCHSQCHHCIPYVKMIEMRCNMTSGHWCPWCRDQHHVMPKASSMTPLHSLGQDDQKEVQHDFSVMWQHWLQHLHHYDANGIVNVITAFPRSTWSKWVVTWHFGQLCHWHQHLHHTMTILLMAPLHSLGEDDQKSKMILSSCNTIDIRYHMVFLMSRWLK